jgi:hypothetical protein
VFASARGLFCEQITSRPPRLGGLGPDRSRASWKSSRISRRPHSAHHGRDEPNRKRILPDTHHPETTINVDAGGSPTVHGTEFDDQAADLGNFTHAIGTRIGGTSGGAAALLISADSFFTSRRVEIVALAAQHRLPVCYPWPQYVDAGGLISYGTNLAWAYEQTGIYAGRILKGEQPGNLPVQMPTTFETAINLKTAKASAITIPPLLLVGAAKIIE